MDTVRMTALESWVTSQLAGETKRSPDQGKALKKLADSVRSTIAELGKDDQVSLKELQGVCERIQGLVRGQFPKRTNAVLQPWKLRLQFLGNHSRDGLQEILIHSFSGTRFHRIENSVHILSLPETVLSWKDLHEEVEIGISLSTIRKWPVFLQYVCRFLEDTLAPEEMEGMPKELSKKLPSPQALLQVIQKLFENREDVLVISQPDSLRGAGHIADRNAPSATPYDHLYLS